MQNNLKMDQKNNYRKESSLMVSNQVITFRFGFVCVLTLLFLNSCNYKGPDFFTPSDSLIPEEEPSLDAPVLTSPQNGASNTDIALDLVWRPLTGASTFELQLREGNGDYGDENSISVPGITDHMYKLEDLKYGTSYSWRVRGFAGDLVSPFSLEYSFSTMEESVTTYNLNVEKDGNGTVTSNDSNINCGGDCSEEYEEGTEVTLTAEAADGWRFDGWSGDQECEESKEDCVIKMDKDRTVKATFKEMENVKFPDPKICIEHGTSQSKILWLWLFGESLGFRFEVTMRVLLPNGNVVEGTVTSSEEAATILFLLDIFTFGNYQWEIVEVININTGLPVPFSGTTQGEVDVNSQEQNPGECD